MAQGMPDGPYRMVTRSDFDGLVSAMLLRERGLIGEVKFVHPKDVQDGIILIGESDITTNLPFKQGVYLAFDHHVSETLRNDHPPDNYVNRPDAPSTARVIFDYYGGASAFPNVPIDILEAVDKCDSGRLHEADIVHPDGWVLLNFVMDARTGLGRFKDFRVSNYQLMLDLIDHCRRMSVEEILALPDVKERVDLYRDHEVAFRDQLKRCTTIHRNLGIIDLRFEDLIFCGNRFMVYALHPEITISMHVIWGLNRLNTVYAVGKSVLDRSSGINIGALMLRYGGGGHRNAGSCQVENDEAETIQRDLVAALIGDA